MLSKLALFATVSILAITDGYYCKSLGQTTRTLSGVSKVNPANVPNVVSDIIVTSERRQQAINKVAASINAATGEQLRRQGISTIADLQKIVPGFHFAQGTYSAPVYSIRGIGFNDSSLGAKPDVALSLDDEPLPFPIMAGGVVLDLARVEVIKGPQGTLYGQNATGGAVNYISAKPTTTWQAGANFGYGNFSDFRFDGFVSGAITDTLTARVAIGTEQSDGWQKSYTRDATLGRKNLLQGRAIFDWKPSDDFKAELSFNASLDKSDTQAAQIIGVAPLNPALERLHAPNIFSYPLAPHNDRAADWDSGEAFRNDNPFGQVALHTSYELSDSVNLGSITSYSSYNVNRSQDADGTSLQDVTYRTAGSIDVVSQEVRLSGTTARWHWITGINYEYDLARQYNQIYLGYDGQGYALAPFGEPFTTNVDRNNQQFNTYSGFGSVDYTINDQLTAHGGLRYTRDDIKFNGCTADAGDGTVAGDFSNFGNYLRSFEGLPPAANPGAGACATLNSVYIPEAVARSLDQHNTPWRVGLDWKPRSDSLLYVSISKGYKSGSYPLLSASVSAQLEPVVQESVQAYEVGFKQSLLNKSIQLNGAAFYYDYSNKQLLGRIVVPVFGDLNTLVNVPQSHITGAELDATWRPVHGLTGTLGVTLIESRIDGNFTNFDPLGQQRDFSGEAFPLTPRSQGFIDAQYERPISSHLIAFGGGNISYQSATNGGLGNDPILAIGSYALIDLRAGVHNQDDTWRLTLWGHNITDQYYVTNADHAANTIIRFTGMPATYGFTLSYRYR